MNSLTIATVYKQYYIQYIKQIQGGGGAFQIPLEERSNIKKCCLHVLGEEDKMSLHGKETFTSSAGVIPFPRFVFTPTQPLHFFPLSTI